MSQLTIPTVSHNVEGNKEFVFNETGNIMVSTTDITGATIPDQVRAVFAEVSVFFAAMTKAMTQSIDPNTGKPYSLYNYTAMQNVIDGSGLFVHVTEEDIEHTTESFGMDFSKELIEGLLGLATGAGALSFAQGMIASMGKAGLNIGGSSSSSDSKVSNIVFVCEYLLGMPIVSAIVVYCDTKINKVAFHVGPCIKGQSTHTKLIMHKDTYLFVTPTFIKEYASDLNSITSDLEYLEFIDYLQALVQGSPIITGVEDMVNNAAPPELEVNKTYVLTGAFLNNSRKTIAEGTGKGGPTVKVAWVAEVGGKLTMGAEVANAEVQPNLISFSVSAPTTTAAAIGVFFTDDKGANPQLAVASDGTYTAVAATK